MIYAGSRTLFGETMTIADAFRAAIDRLGQLLLLLLLAFGIGIGMVIWLIVPIAGWLTGIGLLIFFALINTLAVAVIMLEEQDAADALRRGWTLGKRRFWPLVGFALLTGLLVGVLTGGVNGLLGFGLGLFLATEPSIGVAISVQILQLLFSTLLTTVVSPFTILTYLFFYFDFADPN